MLLCVKMFYIFFCKICLSRLRSTHICTQFSVLFISVSWIVNLDVSEDWILFKVRFAVTNACDQGLVAQCIALGTICTFPEIPTSLIWSLSLVGFCQLHISQWDRVHAYHIPKMFCYHPGSTLLISTFSVTRIWGRAPSQQKRSHWSDELPLCGVVLGFTCGKLIADGLNVWTLFDLLIQFKAF